MSAPGADEELGCDEVRAELAESRAHVAALREALVGLLEDESLHAHGRPAPGHSQRLIAARALARALAAKKGGG